MGSALLSVSALNVLRSGTLLSELNRMFPMEAQNHLYFTLWLGVYSRMSRCLRFSSGGHPPALLFRPDGEVVHLRTPNPPVGAIPEAGFGSGEAVLPPGSCLFVLSDGVYELEQPDGTMGTLRELAGQLADLSGRAGFHPGQILESARERVGDKGLDDDFSLLRLRFPDGTDRPNWQV